MNMHKLNIRSTHIPSSNKKRNMHKLGLERRMGGPL